MSAPVSPHTYRTPANMMTALRILLTPVVVAAIILWAPSWWVLLFAFIVAFTDRIDGWLARRYGTSSVGTFLDPLSDKLIVLGCYSALIPLVGWSIFVPVVLIAVREVAMSWWRSALARRGVSVPARKSGKYKMWVQCFGIGLALIPGANTHAHWFVVAAAWFAAAFTWISFVQYIIDARKFGHPSGEQILVDEAPRSDVSSSPRAGSTL